MVIEKIKILGAGIELLAKQSILAYFYGKWAELAVMSIAGSSKTASRILIFSIAMGAHFSFEVISIETYVSLHF